MDEKERKLEKIRKGYGREERTGDAATRTLAETARKKPGRKIDFIV